LINSKFASLNKNDTIVYVGVWVQTHLRRLPFGSKPVAVFLFIFLVLKLF